MMMNDMLFHEDVNVNIVDLLIQNDKLDCRLIKKDAKILSIAPLETAMEGCLTFFALNEISGKKYLNFIKNTRASFCLIQAKDRHLLSDKIIPIISSNPFFDFIQILQKIRKLKIYNSESLIDHSAIISKYSSIGKGVIIKKGVVINDFVKIGDGATIDENTVIHSFCNIGNGVQIGKNCHIHSNSSIEFSIIENNCIIRTGNRIGQSGFGFIPEINNYEIPHYGIVKIEDNVDLGANTCIDRGVFYETRICKNVKIDNLVQIAHNVEIGENTLIAGHVGIAGSTTIGKYCMIGGKAGISGHLKIGDFVIIHGFSPVTKNLKDYARVMAVFPAENYKDWAKKLAKFNILMSKSDIFMNFIKKFEKKSKKKWFFNKKN